MITKLRAGIAGVGLRSATLCRALQQNDRVKITAVQDPYAGPREIFAREHGAEVNCSSFEELLEYVDLVVLTSPVQHHGPQACAALNRGIHVLSEVPAVASYEQASELVAAVRRSDAIYGMAENDRYFAPHIALRELIRRGDLGEVYLGESDYFMDVRPQLRDREGNPTWKHHWWIGRDGNTYPTHSLGPLLQWFDERIVAVSCVGAGRHASAEHELQDATLLLARTVKRKLLRLGFSWTSPRPPLSHSFRVQGTLGAYDQGDVSRGMLPAIYFDEKGPDGPEEGLAEQSWEPFEPYVKSLLPARYSTHGDISSAIDSNTEHAMALQDRWLIQDFLDAVLTGRELDVDVFRALDLTLPTFAAEASIAQDGAWIAVPNPRLFTAGIGVDPGSEAPLA